MPVIKAILFDLDDTLWSIIPVIQRAELVLHDWLATNAPEVLKRASIESMRERRQVLLNTDPAYQLDLRRLRHAVLTEVFIEAGHDMALVDQAMEVFSRARNEITPFEDVLPTLTRLSGRMAIGSVSNGVADLEAIGIAHLFQASIAAHRFGALKPAAGIFHAACDALCVEPHEAVYVGDDPLLDVEGAQKAGLRAVWMNRPELGSARMLPGHVKPDGICTTMYELEYWLSS